MTLVRSQNLQNDTFFEGTLEVILDHFRQFPSWVGLLPDRLWGWGMKNLKKRVFLMKNTMRADVFIRWRDGGKFAVAWHFTFGGQNRQNPFLVIFDLKSAVFTSPEGQKCRPFLSQIPHGPGQKTQKCVFSCMGSGNHSIATGELRFQNRDSHTWTMAQMSFWGMPNGDFGHFWSKMTTTRVRQSDVFENVPCCIGLDDLKNMVFRQKQPKTRFGP